MDIYFLITTDAEIDKSESWGIAAGETFSSVLDAIPYKLTPIFDRFGVKPTYLLSSEVMENRDCVSLLKGTRDCELGTHLHGELVEPQRTVTKLAGNRTKAMQSSYPPDVEYQKLKNLTLLFVDKFGYSPTSFRAGRFAAGDNTVRFLEELGYLVDSSVTPGEDWNYLEGRANFVQAKDQPYFPSREHLLDEGDSKILEVPVSIACPALRKWLSPMRRRVLLRSTIDFFLRTRWLRPSLQTSAQMVQVIKKILDKHHVSDLITLNMMFHSMELVPNASPYARDEQECDVLLRRIETILEYCFENNFHFVTLSELHAVYSKNRQ